MYFPDVHGSSGIMYTNLKFSGLTLFFDCTEKRNTCFLTVLKGETPVFCDCTERRNTIFSGFLVTEVPIFVITVCIPGQWSSSESQL